MKGLESVNWKAVVLIMCILSFSIIFQIPVIDDLQTTLEPNPVDTNLISYISHEPFNITSNTDFETQGWPGNGSLTNPYLIENLNITSSSSACIWVMNTTSHFIIQNCLFASPVYDYVGYYLVLPITFANVSNGKFSSNQVLNGYGGVSGYKLTNCNISHNCFNVSIIVISVNFSNLTTIHDNTQNLDPCLLGISLAGCRNSIVSSNSFRMIQWYGISSALVYNSSFVNNTIIALEIDIFLPINGIEVLGGSNCTLQGNEIVGFSWSGVELQGSYHLIEYNNITSNQRGILVSSNVSVVRSNTFTDNLNSIELVNSNDTKVYSNEICSHSSNSAGIVIHGGTNCAIYLNEIEQIGYGIALQGATGFNISNNIVSDGRYGFIFSWYGTNYPSDVADGPSYNCDIIDNMFDRGGVFSAVDNYASWNFSNIQFLNNTVNGRPIGFFAYLDDVQIDGVDYGQLFLVNCTSTRIINGEFYGISSDVEDGQYPDPGQAAAITLVGCRYCHLEDILIHNNTIGVNFQYSSYCYLWGGTCAYSSWAGAILWHSHNCYIQDVYFRGNLKGAALGWSWSSLVSDCLIWENEEALSLVNSPSCSIERNTIFHNRDSVLLIESGVCHIWKNSIYWNSRGILLNGSSNGMITENKVYNNTGVGICLDATSNLNVIYNNVFAFNSPNAICDGASNHWDNEIDTGNWWSDWSGEGPYIIDEDDQDNFPMMNITTTSPTTPIQPWIPDPLLLGIAGGVIGVVVLVIFLIDRRRIQIVD